MRFQNGDIVRIARNTRWYGRGKNNPKNTEGTIRITDGYGSYTYKVNWGDGRAAYYEDRDLRLVRRRP